MAFSVLLALIVTTALFVSSGYGIRALAKIPFYWIFTPANTFALIVTSDRKDGEMTKGGGNVVNALHAIPGHWMDKSDEDPMEWEVKPGEDPEHRGFFYRRLGVQPMGSIYYTVRTNVVRRLRFTKKKGSDVYETIPDDNVYSYVPFSGEMSVTIKESDTADALAVDMEFDFIFVRRKPVRTILRLADSPAFLTSMIEQLVNNATSILAADAYLGSEGSGERKEQLARAVKDRIDTVALEELGLEITQANLRSVSMQEKYRAILQERVEAEKKAGAALIKAANDKQVAILAAQGENEAQILRNAADADRIQKVLIPLSENPLRVAVRFAEAYEKNSVVTNLALGGGLSKILEGGIIAPLSDDK